MRQRASQGWLPGYGASPFAPAGCRPARTQEKDTVFSPDGAGGYSLFSLPCPHQHPGLRKGRGPAAHVGPGEWCYPGPEEKEGRGRDGRPPSPSGRGDTP